MFKWKKNKGFVLVYAVFISGIILTIGVGALGLVLRGFQLATTSRDSQMALFAADSAIECVVYWDFNFSEEGFGLSPFAYDISDTPVKNPITEDTVFCNGADITAAASGLLQNPESAPCESFGYIAHTGQSFGAIELSANGAFFDEREVAGESKITFFDLHFTNGAYAVVTVEESRQLKDNENINVRISACGFNNDNPNFSRRVERGVTYQY